MIRLLLVSLIWAFSFGIVKHGLAGVDASFLSFARLLLAFIVFVPILKWKTPQGSPHTIRSRRVIGMRASPSPLAGEGTGEGVLFVLRLMFLGAVQYGLMYLAYLHSFHYLKAYQVAFFTIFTPLWVTLFNDALDRRFRPLFLASAGLAVMGTAVIVHREGALAQITTGFWLVQASNLCFAVGQVLYKRGLGVTEGKDSDQFGWLYLGAALVTLPPAGVALGWAWPALTGLQASSLLYLGLVASGLGFFLWNTGAKSVNAGTLAVMNNLKVPLGVLVSVLVFREAADLMRLSIGLAIVVGALVLNERLSGKAPLGRR